MELLVRPFESGRSCRLSRAARTATERRERPVRTGREELGPAPLLHVGSVCPRRISMRFLT